jgi:hypothetical protein
MNQPYIFAELCSFGHKDVIVRSLENVWRECKNFGTCEAAQLILKDLEVHGCVRVNIVRIGRLVEKSPLLPCNTFCNIAVVEDFGVEMYFKW